MGSLTRPLATIGVLSIGDMGLGIAKLLMAHNYRVLTNVSDRSPATQSRAKQNNITAVPNDQELVKASDYILSIVPPRDALAIAQRVATAATATSTESATRKHPLLYLDLNAISPATARKIAAHFSDHAPQVQFLDGGIIGGPPSLSPSSGGKGGEGQSWTQLSIPLSGPFALHEASNPSAAHLSKTLNIRPVAGGIGSATGLKMCFAALSKGFTALAIQSFTTAASLGVLDDLKTELAEHNPNTLRSAERGLPGICTKAYRWVREMEEIADTIEVDGGFAREESSFRSIARVYDFVANGTVLGEEKVGARVKGKTAEEVGGLLGEALKARKEKTE